MFKFNFEVNEPNSSDAVESPFDNPQLDQNRVDHQADKNIDWYQAEQMEPTKELLNCLDLYELNAKDLSIGSIEIRHLIAGFLLEDIKANNDEDNDGDIKKSEQTHSDLIAGVYEGGAKVWECTDDLLLFLSKTFDETYWKNKLVLDLGCGSGLLGIYALKSGSKVDFQDYNKDVLLKITMPNVLLNCKEELTDDEKMKLLKANSNFYSGDWSHFAKLTQDLEKYDIILTSETIYNIDNQQKLLDTCRNRLKPDGNVLVAAKSHYFGVGGGLEQFVDVVKCGKVFEVKKLWQADENLKRGIIELKLQ